MLSKGLRFLRHLCARPASRHVAALILAFAVMAPAPLHALSSDNARPSASSDAASTLTGTVRNIAGEAVASAAVYFRRTATNDVRTQTDDAGRFSFPDLRAGSGTLMARAGDETAVAFVDLQPGANQVELTFQRKQFALAVAGAEAVPQSTPAPGPTSPAQRDATRPPGTEQRQPVPRDISPSPTNPTTPPGAQRPAPQTPPGTERAPQTPVTTPNVERPTDAPTVTGTPLPETVPSAEQGTEQLLTLTQPRPLPPMPSLVRVGVVSGDNIPLTLNEAIRRALENNNEIEVARTDVRLVESQLLSLRGVYDPVLTFRPEINNSVRPVVNIFGGADAAGTVATTDLNNDFSVTRQFGKGGGNYTYFFNNTRETTTASNNTLNPFYSSSQGLQFTQPLWRNRSIDRNRQQIRIQQKRLEQSDADFRRRTIEIISQVQRAYWDLVFALRDEQNQIANLNLARENFRRTEASVAAGATAPLERAEIQTELSNRESALLLSSQSVTIAENNLKSLIIKEPLSAEWSSVIVPTDQARFDDTPVSLETAIKEARDNRPELRRLKLQQDINDIDIQFFRNQTKPQIDLTGTVSTTGLAGTPSASAGSGTRIVDLVGGDAVAATNADAFLFQSINRTRRDLGLDPLTTPQVEQGGAGVPSQFQGGYFQTLKNLFSLSTRNIVVGVTIQIPLRNRTAEANLATVRIQREQLAANTRLQEQGVEVEVRNAVQSVETARRRVLAARSARENAELQLAGERRLYQVGRSTTFLLFQRENSLVNARNQELRAETDYNKALAELQRATSTTLRANNVIVDSPIGR
ncbi:MAG TPA: TolC family protein [Pyrinomonadaceae bacterium]